MANPAHLKVILKGAEKWNAWRKENSFEDYDLSGADLQKMNLSDVDFSNTNLTDTILFESKMENGNFYLANLTNADLGNCNLISAKMLNVSMANVNLDGAILRRANLENADLAGATMNNAKLNNAKLIRAIMDDCYMEGADLTCADLTDAILDNATLNNANLTGAILTRASLVDADLLNANLENANLDYADLTGADLTGANLSLTDMVETNLMQATITGCGIYGVSAWNVCLDEAVQKDLVISKKGEPVITVDDLAVAQFIYLMLNNKNIRNVLNSITSKGVLILGRFSDPQRKLVLDGLRDKLRRFDLLPMVFDFDCPTDKDYTETIQTLAGMSMFVIADVTSPKSTPLELEATVKQFKIPFVPILDISVDKRPFAMLRDLKNSFHWVLPVLQYETSEDILDDDNLKNYIIDPVNLKREELRKAKSMEPEGILIKKKVVKTPEA